MLRLLVLALILSNGLFYGWSSGLFRVYGFAPEQQSEPQRVAQQIHPDAVRLLSASEESAISVKAVQTQADAIPKECLQAGPFGEAQTSALRTVLEKTLPPGAWQLDSTMLAARWIVYMGKFPNTEAVAKKRAQLAALNLKVEPLNNPALELGLSLGGADSQAGAAAELARLNLRGIRTARVVQERVEHPVWHLKLPAVTAPMKSQLDGMKPVLAGRVLKKCG
jgi:hypothetical protein